MAGNIILYIPDIHNLVRTSGGAYLSAADALMPVIMANQFPIVGTSYPKEFKQFIEPRSDFAGMFESIAVNEISEADAEKVLTYESFLLERRSRITVSFGAIKRAVMLAKKYLRGKYLPSSAEELVKSAMVDAERRGEKTVTPDRVTAVAEEKVNIPMHEAEGDEAATLLHMEEIIHERIVGQDEAVGQIVNIYQTYLAGMSSPGRPIGNLLFLGPTGTGKTRLVEATAKSLVGDSRAVIKIDCSEFQHSHEIAKLIRSPPKYRVVVSNTTTTVNLRRG